MASVSFSQLRQLLNEAPNPQTWWKLKELLSHWEEPDVLPLALDYCQEHLKSWPDKERRIDDEEIGEQPAVWWPLARNFCSSGLSFERSACLSLAEHPSPPPLTSIEFAYRNHQLSKWFPKMQQNPAFQGMKELHCMESYTDGFMLRSLIQNGKWNQLESLSYGWRPRFPEGHELLLHPLWNSLKKLELNIREGESGLPYSRNQEYRGYWQSFLHTITHSPSLKGLRCLRLYNPVGLTQYTPLFVRGEREQELRKRLPEWQLNQLEELKLQNIGIDGVDWVVLLETGALQTLKTLVLEKTPLGNLHIEGITQHLGGLKKLALSKCQLTTEHVQSLLHPESCPQLEELDLSDNELDDDFVREWMSLERWSSIKSINLRRNNIGKKLKRKIKHRPNVEI